jgi:hypothetical protein
MNCMYVSTLQLSLHRLAMVAASIASSAFSRTRFTPTLPRTRKLNSLSDLVEDMHTKKSWDPSCRKQAASLFEASISLKKPDRPRLHS